MLWRHLIFLGVLAGGGGLASTQVEATEAGISLYILGLRGPQAGIVPPPGFYFQNDVYFYDARVGAARDLEIGGRIVAGVKQHTRLDFATPLWVTPVEIFGGNLGFAVTVPFGVPRISAAVLVDAPGLDRAFMRGAKDSTFNAGDPVLQTFVGWHSGNLHWTAGAQINVPAGAYQVGQLSNVALNRWIGDLYGAVTWLDPDIGLDISALIGFEINGDNLDTNYGSGNAFHGDLAISKSLTKELSIGILASHYEQVSDDRGRLGPFRGRATAIGGTIAYNFTVAGTPVSTRLKVLQEVEVENRFRGTIGFLTVSFPLSSPAAPSPPPEPVKAKF